MNGELDDPRDSRNRYYRWNPFQEYWEFWDNTTDSWYWSMLFAKKDINFVIPAGYIELTFKDTWCEPTFTCGLTVKGTNNDIQHSSIH